MNLSKHLSQHLYQVYFGGNWTTVNYRDVLADVSWQEATASLKEMNTMATLVQHTFYYTQALKRVLKGEPLAAKDELSFTHPEIQNEEDWLTFKSDLFKDVEDTVHILAAFSDDRWNDWFEEEKYGTYHRNVLGIIEHLHYHLGQLVIIKKLLRS